MGLTRALGKALREILGTAGDVGKHAAPLAMMIPGVGPWGAAAIGAGSGALGTLNDKEGTNIGRALKGAVKHGATSAAAAHLGGGAIKGLGRSIGGKAGLLPSVNPANPVIPTPSSNPGGAVDALPLMSRIAGGDGGGAMKSLAGGMGGGDMMTKAYLASQGVGAAANVYGANQMGRVEDERIKYEREREERERRDQENRSQMIGPVLQQLIQRIQSGQMEGYTR